MAKVFIPGARACNALELATKTKYLSASARSGLGAQANLSDATGFVSIGATYGAGIAKQWCKVKINEPLFDLMRGGF